MTSDVVVFCQVTPNHQKAAAVADEQQQNVLKEAKEQNCKKRAKSKYSK